MRSRPPSGSKKVTDWVGRRVRSLRDLRNGNGTMPNGTVYKVTYARSGLSLQSEPCKCCGASQFIRSVDPRDVAEVADGVDSTRADQSKGGA